MRFFRRLDPFSARDPEEMEITMDRVPRKLVLGLAKGALMLVVAGLFTLGIAAWLQKNAHDKSMRLTAERNAQTGVQLDTRTNTVPPQSGTMPDGRDVAAPGAPRPLPSPGPNPTPAEPR